MHLQSLTSCKVLPIQTFTQAAFNSLYALPWSCFYLRLAFWLTLLSSHFTTATGACEWYHRPGFCRSREHTWRKSERKSVIRGSYWLAKLELSFLAGHLGWIGKWPFFKEITEAIYIRSYTKLNWAIMSKTPKAENWTLFSIERYHNFFSLGDPLAFIIF